MRKAAVHPDFDFDLPDTGADERRHSLARRLLGPRPAARAGVAALALLSVASMINALFLQDQRHAAPLFQMNLRTQATATEQPTAPLPPLAPRALGLAPAPAPAPAAAPALAARSASPRAAAPTPAPVDPIGQEIAHLEKAPPRAERPRPTEARHADPIGGLMRNAGIASAPPATADSSVLAAQRALMKLGFVVRPDGVFGETTRQAIKTFEQDRGLTADGELTPKIKRELARLSGLEAQ